MFGELIYERIFKFQISSTHSRETSLLDITISSHVLDKNNSLFCLRNIQLESYCCIFISVVNINFQALKKCLNLLRCLEAERWVKQEKFHGVNITKHFSY